MIIECPRCGFSQPQDKYCANCGVDVESYQQKPPSFLTRLRENSSLHLFLIVAILITAALYLMIAQSDLISKEVTRIFNGLPMLSQEGLEEFPAEDSAPPPPAHDPAPVAAATTQGFVEPSANTKQAPEDVAPPIIEVKYIEVSKENVRAMTSQGQVVRELQDWRIVFIPVGNSIQGLLNSSRRLPGDAQRALPQNGDFEVLSGDFDPNPQSPFLTFSMIWTMPNAVMWSLISQLPNPDPNGTPRLLLSEQQGEMTWDPQGALLLVFDPMQRLPLPEGANLDRSPLAVLRSTDFRAGESDLVIWIELKNKPALF